MALGDATRQEREPLLKRAAVAAANARQYGTSQGARPGPSSGTPRVDDIEMPSKALLYPLCVTVWVPVFVAALDSTIVATLVGSVSSSFKRSEQASWLGTSYLLSVCCFSPIYGRLCDVLGRKYAILLALLTFSLGTLACGMAPSMEFLIAARVMAGVGGGGLTTCTSTILSDVIPLRQRGLYQGLTNIVYGAGNALGGPLGGLLNDTIGWRNAFLVQLPFLALAIVLAFFFVHVTPPSSDAKPDDGEAEESRPTQWQRIKTIDLLGCFTLVGSVAPILLSLSFMSANDVPFSSPLVWGNLVGGILCGSAFIYNERFLAPAPILPISLVTQRTGGFAALANFFLSIVTHSTIYNYPLYFQAVRGQSSSMAGLHLVPNSVSLSIGSVFAGVWMRRTGRYYRLNFGNSLLIVVSAVCFIALTRNTPDWATYAAIVPHGLGITGVLTCTLLALINAVPRSQIAVATGMSYLFRTTGQVVGVASSGVLLQAMLKRELFARLGSEDADVISEIRHRLDVIPTLPFAQREAAIESYVVSLRAVFVLVLTAALACSFCCWMMEDLALPDAAAPAPSSAEDQEAQSRNQSGSVTPAAR
jgi:MFS family permease